MNNEEVICKKVAELFANRNWHKLSVKEQEIVMDLVQAGWLKEECNGFVGEVRKLADEAERLANE